MNQIDSSYALQLPDFLEDYGKLLSHFTSHFEPRSSQERGNAFVDFAQAIVPHTEIGASFEYPTKNPKQTWDEGVDLTATRLDDGTKLFIQSKYHIRKVEEFDSVISSFVNFREQVRLKGDQPELPFGRIIADNHFMIVTSSDLKTIISRYEQSGRPSRHSYDEMKVKGLLHVIDGPKLLDILRDTYRKTMQLPANLKITLASPIIRMNNVYVGLIDGKQLRELYKQFGDSIFLENIRDYLGLSGGRSNPDRPTSPDKSGAATVNQAILQTLENDPSVFLARNNGITFRASQIIQDGNDKLTLHEASIVNGCQTTMTIVRGPEVDCNVLVKFVETTNSWDIAEAANFQNPVDQISLKLARYIRPQMIRAAAGRFGVRYRSQEESAFAVVERIYGEEITEHEFRALFLAFFSNDPNNALQVNYTKVNTDVVDQLFTEQEDAQRELHETLFRLNELMKTGAKQVVKSLEHAEDLRDLFQRFWKESKPAYRAYLMVLACCGTYGENVFKDRPSYAKMSSLLKSIQMTLDRNPSRIVSFYRLAFTVVGIRVIGDDKPREETLQIMQRTISGMNFDALFKQMKLLQANEDANNANP